MTDSAPFTTLVPLDGSERSEAVLGLAGELTRLSGGRLVLRSVPQVYGMNLAWYTGGAPDAAAMMPVDDLMGQARGDTQAYVDTVVERLKAEGLAPETIVPEDEPASAIVA